MKRVLVAGLLSLAACAPAGPKATESAGSDIQPELVRPAGGGATVLKVGQVLEIELQGNASTGYQWQLAEDGSPVVERISLAVSDAPEGKPADPVIVGAPSTSRWRFEAVQPGQAVVRLVYLRPWETAEPPARTADFPVTVE